MFSHFCIFALVTADLLVGTWNLKWFPSGRAEHRAPDNVEQRTIDDAAGVIRSGVLRGVADAGNTNSITGSILFFQELRDGCVFSNLVCHAGVTNLQIACVTSFKDWDGRLMWQQCGIATTYPVVESHWSYWKHPMRPVILKNGQQAKKKTHRVFPPRGYGYALVDAGTNGLIACYCVHLKSNYGATSPQKKRENEVKREVAIEQIIGQASSIKTPGGRKVSRIIIAGDFNTDIFQERFGNEKTIPALIDAGFMNCFSSDLPLESRATYPGKGRWKGSTIDYIFHRGFTAQRNFYLSPLSEASDHQMLWVTLD